MSSSKLKYLIIIVWLLILLIGPITLLRSIEPEITFNDPELVINFFQRLLGMMAFSLLFVQLILGNNLNYLVRYLGPKALKYHIIEGLIAYILIVVHPLLYVVFTYQTLGVITLFILPNLNINSPRYELYLTYGRIAFLLLSVSVFAAIFRRNPRLRVHWRKFHILNYFAFYFVAIHAINVGSDTHAFPFNLFYWFSLLIVSWLVFKRFFLPYLKTFQSVKEDSKLPN